MNLADALNEIIKLRGHTFRSLAKKLGYKSHASISDIAIRGDTKVSILMKIANELNYEVVLRPKNKDDRVQHTIVLDELPDRVDNRGKWRERTE